MGAASVPGTGGVSTALPRIGVARFLGGAAAALGAGGWTTPGSVRIAAVPSAASARAGSGSGAAAAGGMLAVNRSGLTAGGSAGSADFDAGLAGAVAGFLPVFTFAASAAAVAAS